MKIKCPKGEIPWVRYSDSSGNPMFLITSKEIRDYYYLYSILESGELKKLGKAKEPTELEKKFNFDKVIKNG